MTDDASRKPRLRATRRGPGQYDRGLSPDARRDQQRGELLDAATAVFASEGFAGATVEAIVSRAGKSRRTFYEYFDDLADVLHAVHDRAADVAFSLVSAATRAESDPLARIRTAIATYLGAITSYPEVARVVFREVRSAGPEYEARRERETNRYTALMFEAVRDAYEQGRLGRRPDELTVFAIASAVEAIGMRHVMRAPNPSAVSESVERLYELVVLAFGGAVTRNG